MGLARDYLNQTATWLQTTGLDADGDRATTSSTILVRIEHSQRWTSDGVTSETRVFTEDAVKTDDALAFEGRTWPVKRSVPAVGFDGDVVLRKVLFGKTKGG